MSRKRHTPEQVIGMLWDAGDDHSADVSEPPSAIRPHGRGGASLRAQMANDRPVATFPIGIQLAAQF